MKRAVLLSAAAGVSLFAPAQAVTPPPVEVPVNRTMSRDGRTVVPSCPAGYALYRIVKGEHRQLHPSDTPKPPHFELFKPGTEYVPHRHLLVCRGEK